MKKRTLIVIAAAGVVALGGGTAVAVADDEAVSRVTRTVTGEPAKTDLTLEQAVAKAQEAVKGTVGSVELEDGGTGWDLDVLAEDGTWHEVEIDAAGKVTKKAEDTGDDDAEDRAEDKIESDALKSAKVSAVQAASAALGSVPGTVTSVDLADGGRVPAAWDVEVRNGEGVEHAVVVDAVDGKVVSSQVDSDDEGDD
ncbi:PepSY domain-containing protein [Actinocorallia populi]|uniref:PepSY domain-containing protein n=1 Tax=Actinocorallia populi TaxID=2079200 RepID=UPI000D092813|nr:PepSY domain-containing protein [Actinocorallia populi]